MLESRDCYGWGGYEMIYTVVVNRTVIYHGTDEYDAKKALEENEGAELSAVKSWQY